MDPVLQYVDAVRPGRPGSERPVLVEPADIPIGRLAVVEDPFGNRLVLLDSTKGAYDSDASGAVTGVS